MLTLTKPRRPARLRSSRRSPDRPASAPRELPTHSAQAPIEEDSSEVALSEEASCDPAPLALAAQVKDWLLLAMACGLFLCLPLLVLATAYASGRFGPVGYLLLCGIPPLVLAWDSLGRAALKAPQDNLAG